MCASPQVSRKSNKVRVGKSVAKTGSPLKKTKSKSRLKGSRRRQLKQTRKMRVDFGSQLLARSVEKICNLRLFQGWKAVELDFRDKARAEGRSRRRAKTRGAVKKRAEETSQAKQTRSGTGGEEAGLKPVRPSRGRSRNGMNLSETVNIEALVEEAERQQECQGVSLEALKISKNAIRQKNENYVKFIKEIEEYSPERGPQEEERRKPKASKKAVAKKRNFRKQKRRNKESERTEKGGSEYETRKNILCVTGKDTRDWTRAQLTDFDTEKGGASDAFSSFEFEYGSGLTLEATSGHQQEDSDRRFEEYIGEIWKRKTKAKMFNWLLEIYVKGFNRESDIMREIRQRRQLRVLWAWKGLMGRLRRENRAREAENRELVDTFRRIILTSKVFIAFKKMQRKKRIRQKKSKF